MAMKPNDKLWTVITAVAFVALAALSMCGPSEADATLDANAERPGCCDLAELTTGFIDPRGNVVATGFPEGGYVFRPGVAEPDDARLEAELGPRCFRSYKLGRARYPGRVITVVCMRHPVKEGDAVAPPGDAPPPIQEE